MNKITPCFNPDCTSSVWRPWKVASLITSLHHTNITVPNMKRPNKIKYSAPIWPWTQAPTLNTVTNADKAPKAGHGLGVTIWNGWYDNDIISNF